MESFAIATAAAREPVVNGTSVTVKFEAVNGSMYEGRSGQWNEAAWTPVLEALHGAGLLRAEVRLARLLIFGALNWAVQWYDRRGAATLDELTTAALQLFIHEA